MSPQAQVAAFLFDPRGRIGRSGLLVSAGAVLSLEAAVLVLTNSGADFDLLIWPLKTLSLWIGLAAVVKRLHDVGMSGWWTLGGAGFLCIWTASISVLFMVAIGVDAFVPGADAYIALLGLVMLPALGVTLWLHFAPGEPQTNRFGPEPDRRGLVGAKGSQQARA